MSNIDPNIIIDFLNSIIDIDPDALNKLIYSRVSCNEQLSKHHSIQILDDGSSNYSVGLLGILNGLCGKDENGSGFIVARVNDRNDTIVSFVNSKDIKNL